MCHIKINNDEKCLVNTKTAEIVRPSCYDTLVVYHSYLVSRHQEAKAEELLKEVFKGEKVISKMIEKAQKLDLV